MARSAVIEAVSHLRQGLNLLSAQPDSPKSQQQELDLQIALGRALIASRGYTDTLVGETYARARHLCEKLGQNEQLLLVIFGEWLYYVLRGELEPSLEMGKELLRAAQDQGNTSFQYLGHSVCSRSFFVLGAFTEARSHGIEALNLYNPAYREQLTSLTAEDPQCATLAFSALVLFCLGHFDQASNHLKDAMTIARSGGEAPVIAYTHGIAASAKRQSITRSPCPSMPMQLWPCRPNTNCHFGRHGVSSSKGAAWRWRDALTMASN